MSQMEKSSLNILTDSGGRCFRKQGHPRSAEEGQGWEQTEVCDTLNVFDNTDGRTPILIVEFMNG